MCEFECACVECAVLSMTVPYLGDARNYGRLDVTIESVPGNLLITWDGFYSKRCREENLCTFHQNEFCHVRVRVPLYNCPSYAIEKAIL